MWGDAEGAFSLREGDSLAQLLARVAGVERLGYNDDVWRDLLLQYEKLVHVHNNLGQSVLSSACKRCAQNCASSSNLATYALHCARIIRDLQVAVESFEDSCSTSDESPAKLRTALIGKSRVTCGAINLLRILTHEVIVDACRSEFDTSTCLVQSFTYRGKEGEQDSAYQVTATIMHFLAAIGRIIRRQADLLAIPEVYDVVFQVQALLLTFLSSQLYQPLISSSEASKCDNLFLDLIMNHARTGQRDEVDGTNEAAAIVSLCLHLFITRPTPPQRSILAHQLQLVDSIVKELVAKKSDDGMHESHTIVQARYIPADTERRDSLRLEKNTSEQTSVKSTSLSVSLGTDDEVNLTSAGHVSRTRSSVVAHPIRSLLLLSSSFFLLPIRLVKLALGLLGQNMAVGNGSATLTASDQAILQQISQDQRETGWNKTSNVLWVTESPLADFGSALLLLLLNNCRAATNPFRCEVASLKDSRMSDEVMPVNPISINFGDLFETFGVTTHTEVSALLLYTLIFASSSFAESVAARIDPDRLILPLLRSLYFSTAKDDANKRPFRSHSQLYVIMILLLIFSQDTSFGRNSFRRIKCHVKFYKELPQGVSLGAAILAVLLRTISHGLEQLQDAFLLSNCFAVLLNLSPHIYGIDPYVANRLVSVAAVTFKRYAVLIAENGGQLEVEGDVSTPIGMHGETCRTLLQLIKHSIRSKCLAKNIHVVYEIFRDQKVFSAMLQYPSLGDLAAISALIATMNKIVGSSLSARKTLKLLEENLSELRSCSSEGALLRQNSHSDDSSSVASDASDLGNLTFQYEEEADPEVFFLPYLWDIVVSTLTTSSSMEWRRSSIQIFALNNDLEDGVANSFDDVSLVEYSGHDVV